MTSPAQFGRLPPEVMRRRYVQMHKQLQEASSALAKLQIRNEVLEAENKHLHARIDVLETEHTCLKETSNAY